MTRRLIMRKLFMLELLLVVSIISCNTALDNNSESKTLELDTLNQILDTTTVTKNEIKGPPLSEQLWAFVSGCDKSIKNPEFEENKYRELIDDSKNGYLHISGSWPTCGCSCGSTVGAYKKNNGSYALLKYETWSCTGAEGIYSNADLMSILPDSFNLNTFLSATAKVENGSSTGHFYLKAEIPQHGTITNMKLELIPFGMKSVCDNGLCLTIAKEGDSQTYLSQIIRYIESPDINNETLLLFVKDEDYNLTITESDILNKILENDYSEYSKEDFKADLKLLYDGYKLHQNLENTSVILDWNRDIGRFQIIDKKGKPEKLTFLDYLKSHDFYSPAC